MKEILFTDSSPAPIGPYSQGIKTSGTLYFFSGQIPLSSDGLSVVGETITDQTHQVCKNIIALLESQNLSVGNVVKTTVFLINMNDFAEFNGVYNEYFSESKPARSTIEVRRLPKDVLVEIECIAVY